MHQSVLQKEVLEYLDPKPNENFIDCTINGGGHTISILEKNKPNGKVLGIEIDIELCQKLKSRIAKIPKFSKRLVLVNGNFGNLEKIAKKYNFKPDGILFDLGMSTWHIKSSKRGFTFQKNEPLIMRYDDKVQSSKFKVQNYLTAEEIINKYSQAEIERILREYGEERFARRIAKRIVEQREKVPIKTTFQLVEIIKKAVPKRYKFGRISPATRTFQALRIAVNEELENLKKALPQAVKILNPNGRLVVISFHSLEDRIVKNFLKEQSMKNFLRILTKKPITPEKEEVRKNPQSRSAKLRAAVKINHQLFTNH